MIGLVLITVVIASAFFLYFRKTVTWKEFLLQVGACTLVLIAGYFISKWAALRDTEYLNGRITKKDSGTQKCCHCQDICDSRDEDGYCTSSHEQCSHVRDHWWDLKTTVGIIDIRDCSGSSSAPKIWKEAYVGEPVSVEHGYTNYLKADKDSIIRHDVLDKFGDQVPSFPGVHSIYKRNPVITSGAQLPEGWQQYFRELNADLGNKRQVDVVVLLTSVKDPTYAQAVTSKWLYGPKNSITVVIGTDNEKVVWARVVTFSKVEKLKMNIRDQLEGMPLADVPPVLRGLISSGFNRVSMEEYEYLAKSMTPPTGWLIFLYILAVLLSLGIGIAMHVNDIFGDES